MQGNNIMIDQEKEAERYMSNLNLTKDRLGPVMFRFTVPFFFSTLLQTLYGTVDTFTVGKFATTASVSAVATGAQVLSLMTFLAYGLSTGATVLLGQAVGAGDEKRSARIVGNSIIDFSLISLLFLVLMLLLYPLMLRLLNIPPEAEKEARAYCLICTFGIPLIIGYNTVGAILRAIGDSKRPLLFVAVACVFNIVGDFVLTGVFKMGAAGVAIATIAAQGISFIYSLLYIMKKGMGFAFHVSDIRVDKETTLQIFKVGLPMGLQSILVNLSFMFITAIINAMGLSASAAMGIGDKIINIAFLIQNSVSAALSIVVAQNFGAGNYERASDAVKMSIAVCVIIELLFCVFCEIKPHVFPSLFTNDMEVIDMAGRYMMAYSIDGVLTSISFCLSGYLNGCGRTTSNMIQNLIATFLGRVPATFLFSRLPNTNLFLIGLAAPVSTLMSIVMLIFILKKGSRT